MFARLCPTCRRAVSAQDLHCAACGADLAREGAAPAARSPGALWLDDQTPALNPAAAESTDLSLRALDELEFPPIDELPLLQEELVVNDPPQLPPQFLSRNAGSSLIVRDSLARRAAKAAVRAAVRRSRLAHAAAVAQEAATVLVLDPEEASRRGLCALLEGFGFRLVLATDIAHASVLAGQEPCVAAFLDVTLDETDGGAGVDLCRQLKATRQPPTARPTALVLMGAQVRPVDRIRAQLAGFDAVIAKPAARGSVARALEDCGVPLPSDARRI